MTVSFFEYPEFGYVEVVVDGGLSSAELARMMQRLEAFVSSRGEVSVLKRIRRPGFINPLAALPHVAFGFRMLGKVRRVGVVTDIAALGPLTRLSGMLSTIESRSFAAADETEARLWVAGGSIPGNIGPATG